MNLSTRTDTPILIAKMSSTPANRKIAYAFSSDSDFLFLDKKDVLLDQILACEKLLKHALEENDKIVIAKEIDELKSALDLLH